MKMKLFAAAVAALAAGGAYAQSSVTLYGVVDAGVEYQNHQPGVSGSHDVVRLNSGNMSGSRWGLRGVEDLGGGLKTTFRLSTRFDLDTGLTEDYPKKPFWHDESTVGLQGNWGHLRLCRAILELPGTTVVVTTSQDWWTAPGPWLRTSIYNGESRLRRLYPE